MEGGPPRFRQDSSCPGVLGISAHQATALQATGLSPSLAGLPRPFPWLRGFLPVTGSALPACGSRNPAYATHARLARRRFGLLPVRSPLLGESRFDFFSCWYLDGSLPSVSPLRAMCSRAGECHPDIRVTPFGHPGIFGYWLLPQAFRSWSRPSSSGGSKASSVDPYSLDHIIYLIPTLTM